MRDKTDRDALHDFITMHRMNTPTRAGRIGLRSRLLAIFWLAMAASLLPSCSANVKESPRKVMFVNFDHERAHAAFARFLVACEALGIEKHRDVAIEFVGVDVMDAVALSKVLKRGLQANPVAIVAPTSPVLMEAVRLTETTPIIFFTHQDPVDLRLAASLTHRPQNLAGISLQLGIEAKMLELLRESAPGARRIGYIYDSSEALRPSVDEFLESSARRHGVQWKLVPVKAIDTFVHDIQDAGPIDAWFVSKASVLDEHRMQFVATLLATRRPAIFPSQLEVAAGAPMSYEAVFDDPNGALARQLDRVLSGVTPGEIPIERPKRFRLSLNVASARAAGMIVSPQLLARADRVR